MRVLFAISLFALAGVLWASFAAAQHIRRARKRRRLTRSIASSLPPKAQGTQTLSYPGAVGPQPDSEGRSAPPPPLPSPNWADWDDVLDPLSEVTSSFSSSERTSLSSRQFAATIDPAKQHMPHPESTPMRTDAGSFSTEERPFVQNQSGFCSTNLPRSARPHRQHAHG